MKTFNIIGSLVLVLGLSMFIGCGDSSDDSGVSSTPATTLTSESVNNFVEKVSRKVGCEYTSEAIMDVRVSSVTPLSATLIRNILTNVIEAQEKLGQDVASQLRTLRATESTPGDCGGEMITTTDEATGMFSFVFDDYCNGELTGERSVVNGAVELTMTQQDDLITVNASVTQVLNIVTTNPETNEKIDVNINLSNGVLTLKGTLALDNLEALDVRLTASSGSITDNTTGAQYAGNNLLVTVQNGIVGFSANFTDPELGTVAVSGSASLNDEKATINIVGSGGSNAMLTTTAQEAVFTVTTNNEPAGVMDCSMVDTSALQEL